MKANKMKKIVFLLFTISVLLTSCGGGINGLFDSIEPENGVFLLYVNDGETVTEYMLSDDKAEQKILDELSKAPLKRTDSTPNDISPSKKTPVYDLEAAASTLNGGFTASWCDGLLVTADGRVYELDFDFSSLLKDYSFKEKRVFEPAESRSAYWIAKKDGGWDKEKLNPSSKYADRIAENYSKNADGVEFTIVDSSAGKMTLVTRLTNGGTAEFEYGAAWYLEVLLDGDWYYVPERPDRPLFFNMVAYSIMPGYSTEMSINLWNYFPLPDGEYRVSLGDGISAEFSVADGKYLD